MPNLIATDSIETDPNNPRRFHEFAFQVIVESLRVFGFLLPIYATPAGKILSGNQRHKATQELGWEQVPAETPQIIEFGSEQFQEVCISILSNLIVADRDSEHFVPHLSFDDATQLLEQLKALPDVEDRFPCMQAKETVVTELAEANPDIGVAALGAKASRIAVRDYKIRVPIVTDSNLKVICGRSRLTGAMHDSERTWPVVQVHEHVALAARCLNLATMEFDWDSYKDVYRCSPWLNKTYTRPSLGIGMTEWSSPGVLMVDFSLEDPAMKQRWIEEHGKYVCDLGAGHLTESAYLNSHGIRAVPFEPFILPPDQARPDLELSRKFGRKFLKEIARGRDFDSVFLSAVLNQVPFKEDRILVLTLAHALCSSTSTFYAKTLDHRQYRLALKRPRHGSTGFVLNGPEPGTLITTLASGRPVVQKFHNQDEMRELCNPFWADVFVKRDRSNIWAKCRAPRKLDRKRLREAIEFEFDMPFWTGDSLDLVDEAIAAFEKRLRIKL